MKILQNYTLVHFSNLPYVNYNDLIIKGNTRFRMPSIWKEAEIRPLLFPIKINEILLQIITIDTVSVVMEVKTLVLV